ncbi:MAG: hypothetical protein CMQ38_09505 [Gammaproteobacteria bacterium]|nr:hypothetical protein [Gammaproteobacteria bacterium]
MPRIHSLNKSTIRDIDKLIAIEAKYQSSLSSEREALELAIEYTFLSGYKAWEIFLESVFVSQSRYNDPVSGKRLFPYLAPRTEAHAHDIIKLEKRYVDWTDPEAVISRADILFRNSKIITGPIKSSMQDLRDAKRVRNYIAHGSGESNRLFQDLCIKRLGRKSKTAGEFLQSTPAGKTTHYAVYYLHKFRDLVCNISQ